MNNCTSNCTMEFKNVLPSSIKKIVFICIDWYTCNNNPTYVTSANNVGVVAEVVAEFLNKILFVDLGVNKNNVSLIGHSMGGQVAGRSGKVSKAAYSVTLKRIVLVDPAGPLFKQGLPQWRAHCSDAECVISIHCSYVFGPGCEFMGSHNVIVNKGGNQRPCNENCTDCGTSLIPIVGPRCCSHHFCCPIVANMLITQIDQNEYRLVGCRCYGECNTTLKNECKLSLDLCSCSKGGLFKLSTNDYPPYAMGREGLKTCTSCEDCFECLGSPAMLLSANTDGKYCYQGCE